MFQVMIGSELKKHNIQRCVCVCVCLGVWHRAMVLGVFEDKVVVFFVDNGYRSLVEHMYLRTITSQLLTVPFQAIRCRLAGTFTVCVSLKCQSISQSS